MPENNRHFDGHQIPNEDSRSPSEQDTQRTSTGEGQKGNDSGEGTSSSERELNQSNSGGQKSGSSSDELGSSAGSR